MKRERERERKRENTGFLILSRRLINQIDTNCICCSSEFHLLLDRYSSRLQFYFRNSFRDGLDSADVKMKILISVFNYIIITICYIYSPGCQYTIYHYMKYLTFDEPCGISRTSWCTSL